MTRGHTLVELMISVAVLGLLGVIAGSQVRRHQLQGMAEVQRSEALLLLEYEGQAAANGTPVDAEVLARLTRPLPDAVLSAARGAGTTTFTVTWRDPVAGSARRSLTVYSR